MTWIGNDIDFETVSYLRIKRFPRH